MEKSDKSRLINIKILSVKNQIKLIKKFNSLASDNIWR